MIDQSSDKDFEYALFEHSRAYCLLDIDRDVNSALKNYVAISRLTSVLERISEEEHWIPADYVDRYMSETDKSRLIMKEMEDPNVQYWATLIFLMQDRVLGIEV